MTTPSRRRASAKASADLPLVVGPATIAAYKSCQGRVGAATLCRVTIDRLDAYQRAEYDRLVRVNPDLRVFHRGWVTHRIGNVDKSRCRAAA